MCNCNQKRAMYSSQNPQSQRGMVKVLLKENKPMVINGDITGRMYVFRKINDINWVDKRDIVGIRETTSLQISY